MTPIERVQRGPSETARCASKGDRLSHPIPRLVLDCAIDQGSHVLLPLLPIALPLTFPAHLMVMGGTNNWPRRTRPRVRAHSLNASPATRPEV